MNKIIIVDDHSLFRESIKLLIENENIGVVIAEAPNGQVFLDLLQTNTPDLVLMDIEMPGINGLETTKRALELYPELKILILSMFGESTIYETILKVGAKGCLSKTCGKSELENAISAVLNNQNYFH